MGILERIGKYFSRESQDVYCQDCGDNLTNRGGDISGSGRIYCHGIVSPKQCVFSAVFNGKEGQKGMAFNYASPKQIQRAIRKGELIQFGKLETAISEID